MCGYKDGSIVQPTTAPSTCSLGAIACSKDDHAIVTRGGGRVWYTGGGSGTRGEHLVHGRSEIGIDHNVTYLSGFCLLDFSRIKVSIVESLVQVLWGRKLRVLMIHVQQ